MGLSGRGKVHNFDTQALLSHISYYRDCTTIQQYKATKVSQHYTIDNTRHCTRQKYVVHFTQTLKQSTTFIWYGKRSNLYNTISAVVVSVSDAVRDGYR